MMQKSLYRILIFCGLSMTGLVLAGCQAGTINTAVTLPDGIQSKEDDRVSDKVTGYFERESYSNEEMDEIFYVVENLSEQTVKVSEFYFIQKWVEDDWENLDNNTINQIDRNVSILPGESAEFVFWLSMESAAFDEGTYRLSTRMTFLEENEDDQEGEPLNLFIPFEINE